MKNIGEIASNSTILLEIVTKDTGDNVLSVDQPVTAIIQRGIGDSAVVVDSVTLNTLNNGYSYQYEYKLNGLSEDVYFIIYKVLVNGNSYEETEMFSVKNNIIVNTFESSANMESSETDQTEPYAKNTKYVLPFDFQISTTLKVEENKVHITLDEGLKPNHTYIIYVTNQIQSVNTGEKLGGNYALNFSSSYSPLYASPLEVKSILKDIFFYFKMEDIYIALRNAGQKVHQLLRMTASANLTGFQLLTERDNTFFPASKYSVYQAANQLLNQLIIKMIYTREEDDDSTTITSVEGSNDSFVLGDFEVTKKSTESTGSSSGSDEPPEVIVLQRLIKENEQELKFWKDALMGRNARGYSNPISATSRGGVQAPESRDI
ncbi:Ig-like domain-containing domain [Virgibacillus salexigens]|uniref:Ig-like domain-containing protein n=1 Tax=Virgibacillus massiliensis TaxID=1462526 RepID=UPI00056F29FA|nr:Ig-like domain-containing protein [Virgibacillus massiliensis]